MEKNVQYEKIIKKMSLVKKHIVDLIEYNNIVNYDNIKKFYIKIGYTKENEKSYNYTIDVMRGLNDPEKSLNIRFNYVEKINNIIEDLIKELYENVYFKYNAFKKSYDNSILREYQINFENDVVVSFEIKDEEDLRLYNAINKHNGKTFIKNAVRNICLDNEMKDKLQEEKALKTMLTIENIFESFVNINKIENYENKKQYKLFISSNYSNEKKCDIFKFEILRGSHNPESIVEYSLSIINNSIVYEKLFELADKYLKDEELLYSSISNDLYNKCYNIYLNNSVQVQIKVNNENKVDFFDYLFKGSNSQKDLAKDSKHILKLEKDKH